MPEVLSAASVLVRCVGSVLSDEEAARRHGLDLVDDAGACRLTVPRSWSHVSLTGWDVVRRDLRDDEWVVLDDGTRVTSVVRTVVDLAGRFPLDEAVALADSALRMKLVTVAVLLDALRSKRGPGAPRRLAVAELVDPVAESALESLFRVLVVTSGLPAPTSQHVIRGVGRVDFAWLDRRVVVELDGFAFHSDRVAYRRDRARMNELERQGWRVLRFTWEDVRSRPGHVLQVLREVLALAA